MGEGIDIRGGEGGISCQVKLAAVNFAVGNFAEPPGFCVVTPARLHNVYYWCGRNLRRTPKFAWEISRSISNAKFPMRNQIATKPSPL